MENRGGANWNYKRGGGFRGRGGRGNKRGFRGGGRYNSQGNQSRGYRGNRGGKSQWGQDFQHSNQNQNTSFHKRPKRDTPGKRLSEDEIGVTEYISNHEGFLGIIKSRYSDFQVSEINDRGEMAKLTDMNPPTPPEEETVNEDEELVLMKYNLEILPMETWDNINELAVSDKPSIETVEVDVTGHSKEQRTKIHDAVKKAFGDGIVGSTVNIEDKKMVRFQKYKKGVRIDNRVKWQWPGEYVYFVVHKENCDTMEAASKIAERLRLNIKPSMLGYAGTKDRRAKTSQWFSLRKVDPKKISVTCQNMRDVRVGNFTFRDHTLKLGMLSGNQFRIALRNVTVSEESINEACTYLIEQGFINYYGLQRFGTRADVPTYKIGLKLLQGNLKEAIDFVLSEREGPLQNALRIYKTEGAQAAMKEWPRRARHVATEQRLMKALAQSPNDLVGALDKLPRNTRLLYLHSYQSLLWNHAVSERIKRFGLKPAVGDLVPEGVEHLAEEIIEEVIDADDDVDEDPDSSNQSEKDPDGSNQSEKDPDSSNQSEKDPDRANQSEKDPDSANQSEKDPDNGNQSEKDPDQNGVQNKKAKNQTDSTEYQKKIPVHVITQEDIDNNKYNIFDIVLPLPGYQIEYPPNMTDFYEEFLTKDGLKMDMKHKYKSYSMSGAYRHLAVKPVNMSWRCVCYDDPYADLIMSDWDEMQGRVLDGVKEEGKYKALLLTLTLPASCYATMALRELLKVDTSCDNQSLQNNYHKRKESEKTEDKQSDSKVEVEVKTEEGGDKEEEKTEESKGEKRKVDDGDEEISESGDPKKVKHE